MCKADELDKPLEALKCSAIVYFNKPLWQICEDVLNTQNIYETVNIGFATLLYGGLCYRRENQDNIEKGIEYLGRAYEKYPEIVPYLDELSGLIDLEKTRIRELINTTTFNLADAIGWIFAEWAIKKLTHGVVTKNSEEAVKYVARAIFDNRLVLQM